MGGGEQIVAVLLARTAEDARTTERARVVEEIAALADERAAYHLDEAVADSAAHSGAHKALSNLAETIRRRNGARVVVPLPTSIADGGGK